MSAILVTGSSLGIGASTIKYFAKNGYDVVINYVNHKKEALKLRKYVEETYKVNALAIKCDVKNELEIKSMIEEVLNKFSNIDVLVNNAGIALDNNILDKSKDEFMTVLETNLVGTFLVSKEVIKRAKPKVIINVSSTDSIDTYNELNIDYSSSKAGINILTTTFALSFKDIKVCAVLPNFVDTPSVRQMDPIYLKKELNRINQKGLIHSEDVSETIYKIAIDKNIKSGSLIRIEDKYV